MEDRHITGCTRVRAADFSGAWLPERIREIHEPLRLHRKLWEFGVIQQVYAETIGSGGSAIGFGCGREPIPAWLANRGCRVLATDQAVEDAVDWTASGQHSGGFADLPHAGICDERRLRELVSFEAVDMREIAEPLRNGEFDFTWSAGSFEHVGGIQAGLDFFLQQMQCLRPGGIAAHTTEFNFASNDTTVESHNLVLFRRRDLERLARLLAAQGDELWPFELEPGDHPADLYVDPYPYTGEYHLNLAINGHSSTSILLVARRGG
ncbi:MAG: class I SAM-dependent methyltransferase [Candidatus Eisenbacteria bacterium]|nr:class I SAM-dependent methyltransferase [Candidatus Eisenbacteria bacterium]